MIRKNIRIGMVFLCLSFITTLVQAQDFQKAYRLAEGNKVGIKNVAGDILVKGYDGGEILVTAFKEGRDRDRLTIEDFSSEISVDVRVKYPQDCNCEASIRFEVQVPRALNYNYDGFSTVAGNIKIEEVMGMIRADNISGLIVLRNVSGTIYASSLSGDVTIEQATEIVPTPSSGQSSGRSNGGVRRVERRYLRGDQPNNSVLAKSISGNVKVTLVQLASSNMNQMEFTSLSGNVEVRMPENLGADVEMSTVVGKVETNFALTVVKSEIGIGGSARGRLGDGSRGLKITSTSGNVSLWKN